jgi:subtilisin family serine protease
MKVTPSRVITVGFILILLLPTLGESVTAGPSEPRIQKVVTNSADAYATPSGDGVQVATCRVTLITGDVVVATIFPDGRKSFAVEPADPTEQFASFTQGNDTYIIPSSARLDKLDMNLFDVDYLLREKYYELPYLPLLVTSTSRRAIQSLVTDQSLRTWITHTFGILPAFAAKPKASDVKSAYESLVDRPETAKIWLDKVNHVTLNESVPLIGAPSVWSMGYDGTGVRIAILDTGIDATHPDVSGKIVNAVDMTDDGTTDDLYGHGTHVAIIAAGTGTASAGKFKGVAPGASLMNIKVLNRYGYGYDSWIISGIQHATDSAANIISMSLGGSPTDGSDPLSQAVDAAVAKGVVVAVAAGNSGDYLTVGTPGAARQAITVGASDKLDTLAYFSSRGPTVDFRVKPDVLAPGVNIISGHAAKCIPSSVCSYIPNPPGQPSSGPPNYPPYYTSLSGTSMATPHVSGLIALVKQRNPSWTPAFIKDALINTALQLDGYNVYEQGGGRIQAPDAVQTTMLMDPGSYSFGVLSSPPTASAYSDFAMYNFGDSTITVSFSVTLVDLQTEISYPSAVTLNATSVDIPAGSSEGIRLMVDLVSLPTSLYSGLVYATKAGRTTIHSIFGFAKLRPVTVTKLNRQRTAASDYIYAWKTDASSWFNLMLNYRSGLADTGGHATFFLGDGIYTFASFDSDETGMTIAENVEVSSQVDLKLDERNNMGISFDPAIPDQKIFQVRFRLSFEIPIPGGTPYGTNTHFIDFLYVSNRYPSSSDMFVGATSAHALFNYQYFPGSAYNPADPDFIAATSWGDLQYHIHGISVPIVWVADYSRIVEKSTQYSVKLNPSSRTLNTMLWPYNKAWFDSQRNLGRPFWMDVQWNYYTFLPQVRTEFLSPDTYYSELVTLQPPPGVWVWLESPLPVTVYGLYEVRETWPGRVWEPGELFAETWNGIFSSQLNLVVRSPYSADMIGSTFMDSYLHAFGDNAGEVTGKLTVRKEGWLFSTDLYPVFQYSVPIDGFGTYVVNIHGTQGCEPLSTETDANYTLSIQSDGLLLPPLIEFRSSQLDLYNTATGSPVQIDVRVDTPSSIVTDVTLKYSMDDGGSWIPVNVKATPDPKQFSADIAVSTSGYVSLWATARDGNGNMVSQIVKKAFAVGEPDLTVENVWIEKVSGAAQAGVVEGPVPKQGDASASALSAHIQPGDSFYILATVRNIGGATAYGYYVDAYYDSNYGRGGPVDSIAPGDVTNWYWGPWTAELGTHTTRWIADPDNMILELDETNNERAYEFVVEPSTPMVKSKTIFGDEFAGVRVKVEWRESGHRRRTTLPTPFSLELMGQYKFTAPSTVRVGGVQYRFAHWEDEAGAILSGSRTLSYDVQPGKTLYAVYGPRQYRLTVDVRDSTGARVPYATVEVEYVNPTIGQRYTAVTNSRGRAVIRGIYAGQPFDLRIVVDGVERFHATLTITRNTTYRAYIT